MKSVIQTLRVLDAVSELQPIGLTRLAQTMDIPKSTVQRILKTLEAAGWVHQRPSSGNGQWALSAKPLVFAQRVGKDSYLREAALPVMRHLRDQCNEDVHLAMPLDGEIVIVEKVDSSHAVRIHWPPGQHTSTHASANGKAILAFAVGPLRERYYPRNFEPLTERTITSAEQFEAELALVRKQGYATAHGETRPDIASFAAPILNSQGEPIASISAFLPMYRLPKDISLLGKQVVEAAAEVSRSIQSEHSRIEG